MSYRIFRRANAAALLLCAVATLTTTPAHARQPSPPVEATARALLQAETRTLPGKVDITIAPLDPANNLPACVSLNAFLPAGARAWGRVSVGVSCNGPAGWTVYLAARVAVFGDYLVSTRPLRAGQSLDPGDFRSAYGDLTLQHERVIQDGSQAVGLRPRYAIAAGQTLHADMLRQPPAVKQGQEVRVVTRGPGFQVVNQGRALNNAAAGESTRVRMPDGRVLSGTARHGGEVEIPF